MVVNRDAIAKQTIAPCVVTYSHNHIGILIRSSTLAHTKDDSKMCRVTTYFGSHQGATRRRRPHANGLIKSEDILSHPSLLVGITIERHAYIGVALLHLVEIFVEHVGILLKQFELHLILLDSRNLIPCNRESILSNISSLVQCRHGQSALHERECHHSVVHGDVGDILTHIFISIYLRSRLGCGRQLSIARCARIGIA